MEAINYAPSGQNMILTEDAQIVAGVSGNACYLPGGTGTIALAGDRNELSVSLWRQWDGIVESDTPRGIFSFKNIQIFFDNMTDLLTVVINGFKAITDIKDDQQQTHWGFTFAKNGLFTVYKNAKEVYRLSAGDKPVDMTDGFTIGGGRTHATFDEVRVYKTVLKQGEINGLFYLVSKGTQVKQLEKIVQSATPKYLGVTETVPTTRTVVITKGERLGAQDANAGDWVLMGKTVGGWKVGVCYRWTGRMWINLEPEYNYTEQYQAALYHICEIEELMKNTGHFGALFAKALVVQKALIDKLLVNQAFIKNLVVQKLHIDSDDTTHQDFEAWFDQAHGLKINNKGEEMLRVTPDGTLLLAKKIFFNFVQHKDIGNVLYTNSVGESCKDIFNRYGSISKTAYGYLDKDFIHKITIQKVDDANVDYWCFVHLFFGRSSRGFWYKFSIPKDKYLITFFGKDKTYTYLQIRHPAYISYPPDGTKLDGFYGSLLYNNTAAEKFHSDKRIYKTSGGGYYESAVGYIGENVTPGEIFEYDKIIEEKNPPAIVLYDDDPYKITSVMKFENIPEAKPSAPNIIWKDGEFLKIS